MFVRGGVVVVKVGFSVAAALAVAAVALAVVSDAVRVPYKIGIGAIVVMLAVLFWIGRRASAQLERGARIVRVGGSIGLCALVLVVACVLRFKGAADTPVVVAHPVDPGFSQTSEDIQLSLMFFGLVTFYTASLTAMTSQRSRLSPRSQTVGTAIAIVAGLILCALVPLGSFLQPSDARMLIAYRTALVLLAVVAPFAAGVVACRRARADGRGRWRGGLHAAAAGLMAAAATALVLSVVMLAGMLIFSGHVTPVADSGPYLDSSASIRRTIGGATGVLLFMVMSAAPLVGLLAGAVGGAVTIRAVRAGGRAVAQEGIA
jgi:hypothetical protein